MPLISLLSFLLLSSLSVSLFLLSRMIPDDAADPRDVYCADAAEEDRETGLQSLTSPAVAWLCRDNARGEVLRERAAGATLAHLVAVAAHGSARWNRGTSLLHRRRPAGCWAP